MYLPRTLPLCEPHVATWIGASGRRYDFAVSRPATTWLDEAAVFVLVKCDGERTEVLHVGHACSLHKRFGLARERCPEIWRRALTAGMTHVHLRFEACSEPARQAEVDDLVAALHPALPVQPVAAEEALIELLPALAEVVDAPEDVLVPYRARLKPTRGRDPHIDIEAFDIDLGRGDLPFGHAYEAPRSLRADPARGHGEAFDDFEAMLREAQLASEPAAAIVVLPAQPAAAGDAVAEPGSNEAAAVVAVLAAEEQAAEAEEEPGREPVVLAADAEPVGVAAAEDVLSQGQAVGSVAAAEVTRPDQSAQAVGPIEVPPPEPRAGRDGQARGLFGRWLHALAERSGRWLGAPSRSHAAATASPDAGFTGATAPDTGLTGATAPAAALAEAPAAVAEHDAAYDDDAHDDTRAEMILPAGVIAADATGMADIAKAAAPPAAAALVGAAARAEVPVVATNGPAEPAVAPDALAASAVAPDALTASAVAVAPAAGAPDSMVDLGAAEAAAAGLRSAFPHDFIATAPGIAVIDLLADDVLADAAIGQADEEWRETGLRSVDGRNEETSAPAAVALEDGRAVFAAAKRTCAFDPAKPVVLFADEVSPEAGADILADAIVTVCGSDGSAQFAFAGEGGLRGELQQRLWGAGLGERCRFLGDVPAERFERLLIAADILVVPARVRRGEELARLALSQGKWVLATHQSEIGCIRHGENGLLTYDNPGSLVWGVRELLGRVGHPHQDVRAEAA